MILSSVMNPENFYFASLNTNADGDIKIDIMTHSLENTSLLDLKKKKKTGEKINQKCNQEKRK